MNLLLLNLETSRNLALSLANSFGERHRPRLKLPHLSTLSLSLLSLQWARIPGNDGLKGIQAMFAA